MSFSCGIVGLPNVGKSTIFNALTSGKAASENFPFCTIEPNTGVVNVPDPRLLNLAEICESKKVIPTQITFVDIAGLIKGASQGEGLGNQFLGHIRSVDAIVQVVRCFDDENIIHVDGDVNPLRDIKTIETELLLSDIDSLDKVLLKSSKSAKSGDKTAKAKYDLLKDLLEFLNSEQLAKNFPEINNELISSEANNLLTSKQVMYVANVSEDEITDSTALEGNKHLQDVKAYAEEKKAPLVIISGKLEAEIAELELEERAEYLQELGLERSGLDLLTLAGYKLLNLITFFTVGPKEAHAWTVTEGTAAPQAAGKIHSDFESGFIRAEVIGYEDYAAARSEVKVKENGKLRVEGKEYIVQDGDSMHFRFNN